MADGVGCGVSSQVFAASVYEWVGGWDGSGEPGLETRLSEMWVSYESTPTDLRRFFRFRGTTGISRVGISQEVGVFAHVVIRNSKARVEMEGVVGAQRDKDIS